MSDWVNKDGYSKKVLAVDENIGVEGCQVQLAKIGKGERKHYHKNKTEIFYFLKGHGFAIIDGEKKKIEPGTFLVMKPNQVHTIEQESPEMLEVYMVKINSTPDDTYFPKENTQ